MTRVKGFGVEAAWSASDVLKVAEEVSGLPHAPSGGDHRPPSDKSVELAHIEPGAGVLNMFLDVEREVGRCLSRVRVPWPGSPIPALQQSDLPPNIKGAVRELASLRNATAHGADDVSLESALVYIVAAQHVARAIALGDYDRA